LILLTTLSTTLSGLVYPKRALLESPSMTDEGGVLGNLPNTRPGKRSAKRERPARATETAAVRAEAAGKPAAEPARSSAAKRTSAKASRTAARRPPETPRKEASADPVGTVVRTAAGLAASGVKAAGAVTQELLRRLPRP
jgi:hypothetical protein